MSMSKLCIDCNHYKFDKLFQFKREDDPQHLCTHPNGRSPVIGESTFTLCETARDSNAACGREGRWWERKGISVPPLPGHS